MSHSMLKSTPCIAVIRAFCTHTGLEKASRSSNVHTNVAAQCQIRSVWSAGSVAAQPRANLHEGKRSSPSIDLSHLRVRVRVGIHQAILGGYSSSSVSGCRPTVAGDRLDFRPESCRGGKGDCRWSLESRERVDVYYPFLCYLTCVALSPAAALTFFFPVWRMWFGLKPPAN